MLTNIVLIFTNDTLTLELLAADPSTMAEGAAGTAGGAPGEVEVDRIEAVN